MSNLATNALFPDSPSVAADVQAGRNNTRNIGTTDFEDNRIVRPQASEINQDNSSNTNIDPTTLILVLGVVGFLGSAAGLFASDEIKRGLERWRRRGHKEKSNNSSDS